MRGLLLIAGVLATSQPAWAKYDPCGHFSVFEPGGRVPRNAKVWVWQGGREPLRILGHDLDRAIAPPLAGPGHGLAVIDPGLLGRDATYRIAIVGDGHAWTVGELVTGSDVDQVPPRAPRFRALAITQLLDPHGRPHDRGESDGFDGFGPPAADVATALELSDDTMALDVTFDDSTTHFLVPREHLAVFGRNRCGPARRFRVGAHTCMSIRAIDLAGNRSDAATRCTVVGGRIGDTSRTAHAHAWPARRPGPPEGPSGWLAIPVLVAWVGGRLASRRLPEAHALA